MFHAQLAEIFAGKTLIGTQLEGHFAEVPLLGRALGKRKTVLKLPLLPQFIIASPQRRIPSLIVTYRAN